MTATNTLLDLDTLGSAVGAAVEQAPEMASPWRAAESAEGHRLYVRERADGMWLLAVLPEPPPDQ